MVTVEQRIQRRAEGGSEARDQALDVGLRLKPHELRLVASAAAAVVVSAVAVGVDMLLP